MRPKRTFTIRNLLAVVILLCIVLSGARFAVYRHLASTQLEELLAGNQEMELSHWVAEHQQRRLICSDEHVLEYMASRMRNANFDRYDTDNGVSYEFTFCLCDGAPYSLSAYVDAERFSLAVPSAKPVEGFWPTHDIRLTAPIPNRVAEIFEFLNAPWEEVGGLVLIVEDDRRFRYEYDARLHMRNPPGSQVSKLTAQSND